MRKARVLCLGIGGVVTVALGPASLLGLLAFSSLIHSGLKGRRISPGSGVVWDTPSRWRYYRIRPQK